MGDGDTCPSPNRHRRRPATADGRPLVHPVVATARRLRVAAHRHRHRGLGGAAAAGTVLWVLVLAGAVAVLLGRALDPVANVSASPGAAPGLVALTTLARVPAVMAGIVALLVPSIVDEFSDLGPTLEDAVDDLEDWLVDDSPFDVSRGTSRTSASRRATGSATTLESQSGTVVSGTVVAFEVHHRAGAGPGHHVLHPQGRRPLRRVDARVRAGPPPALAVRLRGPGRGRRSAATCGARPRWA